MKIDIYLLASAASVEREGLHQLITGSKDQRDNGNLEVGV